MRTAALLVFSLLISSAAFADVEVRHSFQSSLTHAGVQRVVIAIPSGEIEVRNGAANTFALSGYAKRDYQGAKERQWAQKVVDDISVEVYVNGAEAIVRRRFGPNASSFRAQKFSSIGLVLDVPRGVDVYFETTFGEVRVDGLFGNVDVDLSAGEITMRTPRSSVRELNASCRVGEVRADLGDKTVTREGLFPGKTNFYNPNGKSNVHLHVTAGEVDVTLTE
jgi:opacity protein-like surface antigen